ncbi:conserved hypothetical protein [Escherichia coli H736]|nr:conserved hypothetical protein [Escherichia coli H736]KDT92252.1 hypothetical protein AC87_3841 [Escherichia coli 3-105-05_S4_C1]KEM36636.1 hypothetical protein AD21_2122 [Escherichia coli 6-319-05_S4_C2]KEM68400.1 hypothetical protein AD47_2173 [Escherichia coli 6-319-05_S4_C3]OSM03218.1 hypothetical protein ERAG_00647 [Escherichia coli R424]
MNNIQHQCSIIITYLRPPTTAFDILTQFSSLGKNNDQLSRKYSDYPN